MRSKALRGLYVLRRQLRAAKTGRSNSAVIVKNHGTASIGARSHGGGIAAHAPQAHQDSAARRHDDARLRLRCGFYSAQMKLSRLTDLFAHR